MKKIKEKLEWINWEEVILWALFAVLVTIVLVVIGFIIYCEVKGIPMNSTGSAEKGLSVAVRTAMNMTR